MCKHFVVCVFMETCGDNLASICQKMCFPTPWKDIHRWINFIEDFWRPKSQVGMWYFQLVIEIMNMVISENPSNLWSLKNVTAKTQHPKYCSPFKFTKCIQSIFTHNSERTYQHLDVKKYRKYTISRMCRNLFLII